MYLDASKCDSLLQSLIPAIFGLAGVIIGGCITAWDKEIERKNAFLRDQLQEFYAPLLGMYSQLTAQENTHHELEKMRISARVDELKNAKSNEQVTKIQEYHSKSDSKLEEYNLNQFNNEKLPLYQNMLDHFTTHLRFAEPSTKKYYDSLVNIVEIFKRHQKDAIDPLITYDVLKRVNDLIAYLVVFNQDLQDHFEKLQKKLKK